MSQNNWDNLHKTYQVQDWITKPNIFALEAIEYLPSQGRILELGAGQGQDSRFFASKGYEVISTDISDKALELNESQLSEFKDKITIQKIDLTNKLPFNDKSFDIVYAHLSLHYFDEETTKSIFSEIKRVLKPGGIFAAFTNSVNDPEFNTGKRLEQEYFEIEGVSKRFFSKYSMDYFAKDFQVILLDEQGKTYKDEAKGVHNLVRFIGKNYPRVNKNQMYPFVSAIIERERNGETEILMQTRWRPNYTWNYHNTLEIPAGVLDHPYENILDALAREIKEETGLALTEVVNLEKTEVFAPKDDGSFAFRPFCASQQLKGGLPWVGFSFVCKVKDAELKYQEDETRSPKWVKLSELKKDLENNPEKFFTLHLGTLQLYIQHKLGNS